MAYRRSRGKARTKKLEPAVLKMVFTVPSDTKSFIDLSQVASIVNRRFYRQGIAWVIGGFELKAPADDVTGSLTISKIPTTWVASNAWEKSFRVWRKQINDSKAELGDTFEGKFADFKVHADEDHKLAGFGANLMPKDANGDDYSKGEWSASEVVISTTDSSSVTEYVLTWVGPNSAGLKSMIQGYADSRALPFQEDPVVPDDASLNWMSAMFNEGTLIDNAVIGNLEGQNNRAPYPFEGDGNNLDTMYPGGETQAPGMEYHDEMFLTGTTISNTDVAPGGQFWGGLVKLDASVWANLGAGATVDLIVTLVPGSHRGYLCQDMKEV